MGSTQKHHVTRSNKVKYIIFEIQLWCMTGTSFHKVCVVFSIGECVGCEGVLEQGKNQPDPLGCQEFCDFLTKCCSNEALGSKSIGICVCKFICRHTWHVPLGCSFLRCTASWTWCLWCNGESSPHHSTCGQGPALPSCLWRYSAWRWSRTAIFYGSINSELNTKCLGWKREKVVLFGHWLFVSHFLILKAQKKAQPLSLSNQPRCCRRSWLKRKQKESWILILGEYKWQFSFPSCE